MSSNPVKEVVNNGNKKKGEVESRNNFPIHELIETAVRAHFRIVRYTMTKFENKLSSHWKRKYSTLLTDNISESSL